MDQVESFVMSDDGRCRHLVTLNPEYVMLARRDAAFKFRLRSAELVVADGIGVIAAARMLHGVKPDRVTGVDLVESLVAHSGRWRAPVFLLGAREGVARRASDRLRLRHADALIAGSESGLTSSLADDEAAIARIRQSGARVVLVAFGAGGQVGWIDRNRAALGEIGVHLAIGVGGAFDYLAGDVSRAPAIIRTLGLEWVYRLIREPWRWRRQRILPVFAWLVIRDWMRGR